MRILPTTAVLTIAAILLAIFAARSDAAPGDHWCRQGDPPILASKHTSCPFAGNMVTGWVNSGQQDYVKLHVKSPVTGKKYPIECWVNESGSHVKCMGKPKTGIRARFSTDI